MEALPHAAGFDIRALRASLTGDEEWVWETDADLRFSWLSPNYEAVTGISPEACLGRFRFDFLRQESRQGDDAARHLEDLQARRPFRHFIYELADAKPECAVVSISGDPQFDAKGKFLGYAGIGRNLTPLMPALRELGGQGAPPTLLAVEPPRQTTAAPSLLSDLLRMVDAVPIGMLLLDADLKVELMNGAFRDLWQLSHPQPGQPQAGVGSFFRDLMEASRHIDASNVANVDWEAFVSEREAEIRLGREGVRQLSRKDGCTMLATLTPLPGGKRFLSYVDVTELKRRRGELAASLEASRLSAAVLDKLPDPVFVKDAELRFVLVNDAFAKIWNTTPEQMVGKRAGDFTDPEQAAAFEASERRVIETGEMFEAEEDFEWRGMGRSRIVRKARVTLPGGKRFMACAVFDVSEMRRREREAEDARKRLAEVIESLPAGVIIYDEDDRFVLANRQLQESLPGLAPAYRPGASLREALSLAHDCGYFRDLRDAQLDRLYARDKAAWIEAYLERYRRPAGAYEREHPDGRCFQVFDTRMPDGTFIGVRLDITELKRREKALEGSMRQTDLFRHVLDELPVPAFIKSSGLRIEYVNKAWCAITGIPKEEAVGQTDGDLFSTGESQGYMSTDGHVIRTGRFAELEEAVTHRDGTVRQLMTRKGRLVAGDGSVHLVGSSTDITDVKAREEQLKESSRENELFRNLIDNVPVAIYAKKPDLRLAYVNRGWCELTGFTAAQAIGRTDAEIFGRDGEAFMEGDRAVLRTGQAQEIEEAVAEPGGIRYQIARKGVMTASDGSLYLIGSTTDISELKRREEELQEARRRAVLADRAKSEFLANMSHEIRTPMNGVLGMAELLAKTDLQAKQQTFVDIIVKSGNALLTIINDILDFSKIDAGQLVLDPAPFNLGEAVEDVATLVSAKAREKDLELIVRIDPAAAGTFVGDVGRFRQIVTNLVGNAVKFTDAGHVLVEVSAEECGTETELTVSVTDTGIGIPADKLDLVFEKFAQVDGSSTRRHEGTGLGLAITARLVALMRGRLGVRSDEGAGSTFWFTLPLPRTAALREENPTPPLDVSGARVLVIDDNPVNRAILSEQMASWGFDACAAQSGVEGIEVLRTAHALRVAVDCVVLDYQMPGMTGLDVARRIRSDEALAATPIVLLTSVDQALGMAAARELGFEAQLMKPARSSQLVEAIVGAIQKRRAADRSGAAPRAPAPRTPMPPPPAPAEAVAAVPVESAGPRLGADVPGHRVDILVAEDNEVNQLVFTQILSSTPYSFQLVGNGRLACEAFRTMNPRMVLMDVSMPEMNGLEASAEIRRMQVAGPLRTPIVGVTAHALKGDRDRCLEAGMDDYLPKPISPRALLEKIERWIGSVERMAGEAG
jgi:PAS domain S-box-containing protein